MKLDNLLMQWCQASWHSWMKEEPQWLGLFARLWARMPQQVTKRLLADTDPLVVLPPVNMSRAIRLEFSEARVSRFRLLQLEAGLLRRPLEEALAILAHELGHLMAIPSESPLQNDLEADRLAIEWGFGDGLLRALERDEGSGEARRLAAQEELKSRRGSYGKDLAS